MILSRNKFCIAEL